MGICVFCRRPAGHEAHCADAGRNAAPGAAPPDRRRDAIRSHVPLRHGAREHQAVIADRPRRRASAR
jgi:hypothetical protein